MTTARMAVTDPRMPKTRLRMADTCEDERSWAWGEAVSRRPRAGSSRGAAESVPLTGVRGDGGAMTWADIAWIGMAEARKGAGSSQLDENQIGGRRGTV